MLPNVDNPEAFGQHPNADIASQITEARTLFETLLSLQPKTAAKSGVSQEDKVSFCTFGCYIYYIGAYIWDVKISRTYLAAIAG